MEVDKQQLEKLYDKIVKNGLDTRMIKGICGVNFLYQIDTRQYNYLLLLLEKIGE